MKLYYSPTSPYVRKVMMCAIELGLDGKIEKLPTAVVPISVNEDYAGAVNPLGKVPALTTDEGDTIYDSLVICDYLNEIGAGRFLPSSGAARRDVLTRHAAASGATDAALLVRYEMAMRPDDKRWQDWIDGHFAKIWGPLSMSENGDGLNAERLDLGDIALGCLLAYLDFRFDDEKWRERFPKLAGQFEALEARSSFQATAIPG